MSHFQKLRIDRGQACMNVRSLSPKDSEWQGWTYSQTDVTMSGRIAGRSKMHRRYATWRYVARAHDWAQGIPTVGPHTKSRSSVALGAARECSTAKHVAALARPRCRSPLPSAPVTTPAHTGLTTRDGRFYDISPAPRSFFLKFIAMRYAIGVLITKSRLRLKIANAARNRTCI